MVYKGWKIEEELYKGHYVSYDLQDCDNHDSFHGTNLDEIKVDIDEYLEADSDHNNI
tara:strand:+ start:279 stop:449 length:171 start_codon:yes stop_codon:yes gene_type:complete